MSLVDNLGDRSYELPFARVAAPMVRYSKLPFRELVRPLSVDISFTPMIVASDFVASKHARDVEFTTNHRDGPLVVQFAANDPIVLSNAAALVANHCDMVDLNCGCPQKWAMQTGYGASLLRKIEHIEDMVKTTRRQVNCPVSVKIRICSTTKSDRVTDEDIKLTTEAARQLEHAGVSVLTIHGRNAYQNSFSPVNVCAIRAVRESINIPVIANGGIYTLQDAIALYESTNVHGIMAASGLLANPAMFTGCSTTPLNVVKRYLTHAIEHGTPFAILHHHLIFMLENSLPRAERRHFNTLSSMAGVLDFLEDRYAISFQ